MAIEWTPVLSVDNREIDKQHKELFSKVNALVEAIRGKAEKEEVATLLRFLEKYAVVHFGAEEKLMLKHTYTKYPHHKLQHEAFKKKMVDIKGLFEEKGPALAVAMQIHAHLSSWLVTHIPTEDREFAGFLKAVVSTGSAVKPTGTNGLI